ncbi:MAG: HlyC/CorC family transporter [Eubacterium sp.]|nr:HlyC/CorC family transporter [Candidatus Colimonas fimequi]
MSSDPGPLWGQIIAIVVLFIINGFFSASFTAIESCNRNDIKELAHEGNIKAKKLLHVVDEPYKFLLQLEVTRIVISFITYFLAVLFFTDPLYNLLLSYNVPYSKIVTLVIFTLIFAFILLIFAVLFPRRLGLLHADGIALATYGKLRVIAAIFKPMAALINGFVIVLLKIFRQRTDVTEAIYSEDEVVSMLESGQESGELKEEGMKMITSIFAFDDMLAYEVMTPRTDVFAIDINEPTEEYIDELMELRYSRIPVYEDDSDNIIGILYIKDFLIKAREEGFDNVDIRSILRKPYLVPETKKIDTLLVELQSTKQHIAILIDEYGGFSGIVTMEDIIEEVMGDIDDEYDEEEPEIQKISDNEYIVDGSMDLDDINEELDIDLESDNSETIGGLIIDILGEIPDDDDIGSVVEYERYKFRIDSIRDRRIEQITMTILPPDAVSSEEEDNN